MSDIRQIFESDYCGIDNFLTQILSPIFGDYEKGYDVLTADKDVKEKASQANILEIRHAASFDFYGSELKVFDITVGDEKKLENNRVGIQSIVRQYIAQFEGALIIFHHQNVENQEWRFSYVEKRTNAKDSTSAKRYTYILGKNHPSKTITENFKKLEQNKDALAISDLTTAFSVAPLSNEFFDEYREHYADLVEYISGKSFVKKGGKFVEEKTKNANGAFKEAFDGDDKLVRDYVKKMMGRLVFLHFLQKKGWLGVPQNTAWGSGDKNFIYNLFYKASEDIKKDFLEQALEPLFFKTLNIDRGEEAIAPKVICDIYGSKIRIPYLNGGLFEEDELDKKKVKFKKEHFEALLEFFNQYNFTIDETDPDDQEIGVDPEMLGKIFENLLEDNKDKGAFYTPKEIVQYMCRESLIAYLNEKTKIDTRSFVIKHEASFTDAEKANLLKALLDVKVCDPAVGSGAFPMGMLNELLACTQILTGNSKTRAELKKHIVKNNIYGVDIEKGAVDIARLRFWLAIIVDEEKPIPLPNLDYKIMQGNSLLESFKGIDLSNLCESDKSSLFDDSDDITTLLEYLKTYFDKHNEKNAIRDAIKASVMELLHKRGISGNQFDELEEIDLHSNSNFFLWHTWFNDVFNRPNDCNGFDIVIGNPPYVQIKWLKEKELYKKQIIETFESTGDIYCLFYERGINLLNSNGHLIFITSNKWLKSNYGAKTRNYIADKTTPKVLIDLGAGVFESATVDTSILLTRKGYQNINTKVSILSSDINNLVFNKMKLLKDNIWNIESYGLQSIKNKIEEIKTHLSDFDVELDYGILTGANKTFILSKEKADELCSLDKKNKEIIKPILRGKDLEKYSATFNNIYLLCTHNGVKSENIPPINVEKDYPTLLQYFESFGDDFKNRGEQGDNYYNLRNCAYIMKYLEPKIIYADIVQDTGKFYLDEDGYFTNDTAFLISGKNLVYLLGILNSKAFTFFYKNFYCGGALGDKGLRYKRDFLLKVPVPIASKDFYKKIVDLVGKIRAIKKEKPSSDTTVLESELDETIYDLYGLDEKEKLIIRKM